MSSFFSNASQPRITFLKYLAGSLFVILAAFIGQIPLVIAVVVSSVKDGNSLNMSQEEMLGALDSNLTLFLLLLSFATAMLGLYFAVRVLHRQSFKSIVTGREKVDYSRVYFAFFVWTIISASTTLSYYILQPEDYVVQFELLPFIILALIAIPLIPVQTTLEELLFRGYLMQGFAVLFKNRWLPWIFTSVIFGSLHFFNPEVEKIGPIIMFYYIGTGLFLGLITLMDDGAELAIGFHAANNLIAALLVTADWTAFKTNSVLKDMAEPSAGAEIFLPLIIIFPILTLLFAKKYKWSGWKEKLTGSLANDKTHGNSSH